MRKSAKAVPLDDPVGIVRQRQRRHAASPAFEEGVRHAFVSGGVEDDLRAVYNQGVFYANDAFDGLHAMDDLTGADGKRETRLIEGRTRKELAQAAAPPPFLDALNT